MTQHNCLWDPNAPGSATGVPTADTVRTGVGKAKSGRLSRDDEVHGDARASWPEEIKPELQVINYVVA
jgi:hypothetical protein